MDEVRYAFTRRLPGRSQEEAIARAREALASEGFGVLTEIDLQATLEKKLGIKRKPYMILGACNPPLANQALEAEPSIGTLLPCNVDIFEGDDGATYVQTVNPRALFELVGKPEVKKIADAVADRLQHVLEKI